MSDTPNHSYNTPEKGTENWHGPLNENFENLEVDVELRDEGPPGSNSYEPADGAKYLDTATGLVYLADGNTWTQVFDLTGGSGGGTSLSGGDGIDPSSISDGDTISVVWNDATSLDANGAINNFSLAADLDVDGRVDQLSGPVAGGETLTNIAGTNLNIDSNGQLNASGGSGGGIQGLSGGDGINPDTIGDGDTLTAAWGDAASLDSNGDINDFSGATDLDSAGSVSQLSGSVAGGQTLTNIAGTNLNIDSNGQLNASGGSGGGIQGLSGGDGINPDTIGDGDTLTAAWGDAASLDSSGDIDNFGSAASLDAAGLINDFSSAASLNSSGTVDAGRYLTTSGGQVDFAGPAEWSNSGATGTNTVSGSPTAATIAGGERHKVSARWATIGGGDDNLASGAESTVAGGYRNSAEAEEATVGGGQDNTASGQNSTVPGGEDNTASGAYSTAMGRNATADQDGAFVVGDSSSAEAQATNPDEAYFQTDVLTVSDSTTSNNIDVTSNNSNSEPQIQFANGSSTADVYAESGGDLTVDAGSTNQIATVETDGSISLAGKVQAFGDSNNLAADLTGSVNVSSGAISITDGIIGLVNSNSNNNTISLNDENGENSPEIFFNRENNQDGAIDGAVQLNENSITINSDTSTSSELNVNGGGDLNIDGEIRPTSLPTGSGTNVSFEINNFESNRLVQESSTARHKTDIQPHSTSNVLNLELRSFEYKDSGTEDVGFIAEEVEEHLPEIVTYDDEELPYSVKYDRVGVHLVPEVRENRERLDDIESDHDTVDDRVAELEAEVNAKETRLEDQRDRIDNLEATVDRQREELDDTRDALAEREEHIADLEAENEHLRERLAAIEDHLGLDPGATRGVADD